MSAAKRPTAKASTSAKPAAKKTSDVKSGAGEAQSPKPVVVQPASHEEHGNDAPIDDDASSVASGDSLDQNEIEETVTIERRYRPLEAQGTQGSAFGLAYKPNSEKEKGVVKYNTLAKKEAEEELRWARGESDKTAKKENIPEGMKAIFAKEERTMPKLDFLYKKPPTDKKDGTKRPTTSEGKGSARGGAATKKKDAVAFVPARNSRSNSTSPPPKDGMGSRQHSDPFDESGDTFALTKAASTSHQDHKHTTGRPAASSSSTEPTLYHITSRPTISQQLTEAASARDAEDSNKYETCDPPAMRYSSLADEQTLLNAKRQQKGGSSSAAASPASPNTLALEEAEDKTRRQYLQLLDLLEKDEQAKRAGGDSAGVREKKGQKKKAVKVKAPKDENDNDSDATSSESGGSDSDKEGEDGGLFSVRRRSAAQRRTQTELQEDVIFSYDALKERSRLELQRSTAYLKALSALEDLVSDEKFARLLTSKYLERHRLDFQKTQVQRQRGEFSIREHSAWKMYSSEMEEIVIGHLRKAAGEHFDEEDFFDRLLNDETQALTAENDDDASTGPKQPKLSEDGWQLLLSLLKFESFCEMMDEYIFAYNSTAGSTRTSSGGKVTPPPPPSSVSSSSVASKPAAEGTGATKTSSSSSSTTASTAGANGGTKPTPQRPPLSDRSATTGTIGGSGARPGAGAGRNAKR